VTAAVPTAEAHAVARWIGPRWVSTEAVVAEFIDRRGWDPDDAYHGIGRAIDCGLVDVATDGALRRTRPRR
jgi:hypothetical protein